MRLGRLAAVRPIGLGDLLHYLHDPLPEGPDHVAAPQAPDWGMCGNDQVGDCTLASVVHSRMAVAAEHAETETWPSDDEIVRTYFQMTGGQDSGLVEANVLQTWHVAGLFGNRLDGYAPQDHRDEDETRSVVSLFGVSYLGVTIPAPAQQQFAAGEPWDLTGTSADREIEGGHAVPAVGYDSDYLYVVTWGRVQPATWRWLYANLEEAWCPLTAELATAHGVDLQALQADLGRLPVTPRVERPSLAEFAATERVTRVPCWLCNLPERAEVEEAVLSGKATKSAAVRWLKAVGYPEATHNRVDGHFANHVKRPA